MDLLLGRIVTEPVSRAVDVYNSAQLSQGQSWQIDRLTLDVMNYTFAATGLEKGYTMPPYDQAKLYNLNTQGVKFTIHISRTSK